MRIRTKLLLLLLGIALIPLFAVTWLDLRATRLLGLALAERAGTMLGQRVAAQMLLSIQDSAIIARQAREIVEMAVELQAREVQAALAGERLPAQHGRVIDAGARAGVEMQPSPVHAGVPVSYEAMVAVGASGEERQRLAALLPHLAAIRARHAQVRGTWQHLVLERAHAVFPAHPGPVAAAAALAWVGPAMAAPRLVVWSPPELDPVTGLPMMTVAVPVRGPAGGVVGATAIDLSLADLLDGPGGTSFRPARAMLAGMAVADGRLALKVIAERDGERISGAAELLGEDSDPGLAAALHDMAESRAGVRRVVLRGEEHLLAYGAIDNFGTHLLFAVPLQQALAEATAARAEVLDRLSGQRLLTWLLLLAAVPVVMAVAVLAARAVTEPVRRLAAAARRLARGDFNARAEISSGDELEELARLFNTMVPQLEAGIRIRQSLAVAQEVQQNLLPGAPPLVAGLDLAGLSLYCDETGGDYYDFIPLPELGPATVAIAVGDVVGHGIAAALMMTTARALLRSRRPRPGGIAAALAEINREMVADSHAGRFMTLFYAVLDGAARRIHWVSAGHVPGLVYDPAEDRFRDVAGPDIPLGIDAAWDFQESCHDGWRVGTVMVIGTDGIEETRDRGGVMFGREAVCRLVRAHADSGAEAIAQALTAALAAHRDGQPQQDDVTMIVIKAVG